MRRSKLLLVLSILGLLIGIAMLFISAFMFDTKSTYEVTASLIGFLGSLLCIISGIGIVPSFLEVFL